MHSPSGFTTWFAAIFRRRLAYICTIRVAQLCGFLIAGITAFLLRFEFSIPRDMLPALWIGAGVWILVKIVVFHLYGLGHGMWRYFNTRDLLRVTKANVVASSISAVALMTACPFSFPRSVLIVDFLISMVFSAGLRAATRMALETSAATSTREDRAFIYGGGNAGALLLSEVRRNAAFGHVVCGFVDDDPAKRGMRINGVAVRGAGPDLPRLVQVHSVRSVLIAIPSATGSQMARIIQHCRQAGVSVRTMPSIAEMVAGRPVTGQIREVAVEDILGREPVELDRRRISGRLRGQVAMVTGAAGSIGSELCAQIARFEPAALIAFEISESGLFHLERGLRERFPGLRFHAEIGSVQNVERLREVFRLYTPSVVYHAAAYKHVPLMERHAVEAVENNVIGTYNVAAVAAEFGAADFVLISSDKAVRPTNVMGATKRAAELVIRALQNGGPRYVSVRFGNVLGSNGSVVPIFQQQIAAGGPVTITHPEMQRYFMTIPEAAQLVLQASVMGRGGETFVLNMGAPVRIVDLARQLILLSGLNPGEDIRIEFTGIRPGEKLCEELQLSGERALPTGHEKISVFAGADLRFDEVMRHLTRLRNACEARDLRAVVRELEEMVGNYARGEVLAAQLAAFGQTAGLARLATAVAGPKQPALPVETGLPILDASLP
jgi:FlaA1/EpsC-like NDP-sugar epimerase